MDWNISYRPCLINHLDSSLKHLESEILTLTSITIFGHHYNIKEDNLGMLNVTHRQSMLCDLQMAARCFDWDFSINEQAHEF